MATKKKATKSVTRTTVLVANHHTGDLVFPRTGAGKIAMPASRIPSGTTQPIDAIFWNELKKKPQVQFYLDKGLLAEVKAQKDVAVSDGKVAELVVPEHLQTDGEGKGKEGEGPTAKVRRERTGKVEV